VRLPDLGRPLHRADTQVRPYNNVYTDRVMVLCRAGHTGWHRTTHCRTTTFPNCFALVAQASLPAIRLWMLPQMLLMAGRDAHPTIVNISLYLKTPDLGRPLHWADIYVRPYINHYRISTPAPIIEYQYFWPRLFTPIHHRRCRATHASHPTDSKHNGISNIIGLLPWIGAGTAG